MPTSAIKKKILFIDRPHPLLEEELGRMDYEVDFQLDTPKAKLAEKLSDYFGIVVKSRFPLDRDFLAAGINLAFVARAGVGVEHIDGDYLESEGIKLITSPEGSRDTVAEHSLGLLLMLMNHLGRADKQVRRGKWIRSANTGIEIKGKTVGILGYGNMGTALARRLSGFDARVIAYDKYKSGYGDAFAEEVSLEELQAESHILSIHIPGMPSNKYFVDRDFLNAFTHPIFLVNTARGDVLHTAHLVEALKSGQVQGAALDVLEYEEGSFVRLEPDLLPEPFQYLRHSDRVVLSPHIAGWSVESLRAHAEVLARKIEQNFAAKTPNQESRSTP